VAWFKRALHKQEVFRKLPPAKKEKERLKKPQTQTRGEQNNIRRRNNSSKPCPESPLYDAVPPAYSGYRICILASPYFLFSLSQSLLSSLPFQALEDGLTTDCRLTF